LRNARRSFENFEKRKKKKLKKEEEELFKAKLKRVTLTPHHPTILFPNHHHFPWSYQMN
jgi:hypothetical protein